uniref:Peptidase A1 domain-containing protein n=1 Tax=Salix viminalis TaxID=40686 RepID=A0A6N2MIH3_SALVM
MSPTNLAVPLLIIFFYLSFISSQAALPLQTPIQKDHSTSQYVITAYLRTPLKLTKLLLDLGATYTWVNCDDYTSSTYRHVPCNSSVANLLGAYACLDLCDGAPSPNCGNNSFILFPDNPIKPVDYKKVNGVNTAIIDSFALSSTTQGSLALINSFIFSCARTGFLKGLAKGVSGLAALGRSNVSIPVQLNKLYSSYPNCFAICLSGSKSQPGVAHFGSRGPYNFLPGIDLSKSLLYTPLISNPFGKDSDPDKPRASPDYYIGLSSIKVNGKMVALNKSLLAIDGETGSGGTKISTVVPYTKLQSSIYKTFITAFLKEAASSAFNLTTTKPVKPFRVCYPASAVKSTQTGPAVPIIDLVLDRQEVVWKIFGSNSMVRITKKSVDLWCLGFVDGGVNPMVSSWIRGPSVVIGGHQLEDNMLQFDLQSKKLGFSSSILSRGTNCASFKFSTKHV